MAVQKLNRKMADDVQAEFVSVNQAEVMTGVSRWTWRGFAYHGKIDSCKVGTRLLIPLREIRRVISEGYRPRVDVRGNKRVKA